ncbi:hypothetical protein [Paraburkholderia caffeinilytica]|uniref:hypothetical protein n=1 Tax=Paraburkholderia caffeinilytica TaxID=1761016 RepID=UPI0038BB8F47
MHDNGNVVIDFDTWRHRRTCALRDVATDQASTSLAGVRGNLHVNVRADGSLDYGLSNVDLYDAPAVMTACMIMMMKLTQRIDEAGVL